MKLEKVLNKPKKGLWVFLFVLGLAVVGTLATSYNFEILHQAPQGIPAFKIFMVALGFMGILGALILIFIRLLREMKISQIQSEFLDRISHELRTPLSTLTLVADLIKSGNVTVEETEQLWKSHEMELNRLKDDVELLLQAARLRESKIKPALTEIYFDEWFNERWESFKLILGPQARVERLGAPIQEMFSADPILLELIFRNLFDNARKFSRTDPVVYVKSETFFTGFIFKKKKWRVSVIDEGLGFQPEHQTHLFKQFSRFRPSAIPGTGLGLYLSAMASKAMGFTLTGQSRGEGKGAQFNLEGNCI